jgi:hypothetical protein
VRRRKRAGDDAGIFCLHGVYGLVGVAALTIWPMDAPPVLTAGCSAASRVDDVSWVDRQAVGGITGVMLTRLSIG